MKYVLIFSFLFFSLQSRGQKYLCNFIDSLGVNSYLEQTESMKQSLRDKGLPEEVINAFIKKAYSSEADFLQIQGREISAKYDSTFITFRYGSSGNFSYIGLTTNKFLITGGSLYRFDPPNNVYLVSPIPDSSKTFKSLNRFRNILNYSCEEYVSLDGAYRIWVSHELPSCINPGISVKNIKGAVLAFEAIRNNAFTRSTVNSIKVLKETI